MGTDRDLFVLITTLKVECSPLVWWKLLTVLSVQQLTARQFMYRGEATPARIPPVTFSAYDFLYSNLWGFNWTNLKLEKAGLVTARWLLSNLVVTLQHYMSYAGHVRKLGILLYRIKGRYSNLLLSCLTGEYTHTVKMTVTHVPHKLHRIHPLPCHSVWWHSYICKFMLTLQLIFSSI